MKKLGLFIAVLFAFSFINAQDDEKKEPYMVKSFAGQSFSGAEARTSGGNITVTGVSSDYRVEVYISGNNSKDNFSKDEIKQRLADLYELEIAIAGNKLIAYAKSKERINDWKKSLSISFKLFVPSNISSELSTSGGNIKLLDIKGKQELSTSGGNLVLQQVSGSVHGVTSGGNIYVENSTDDIDLTTSGGNIHATKCQGKIKLSTSGGSLRLIHLDGNIHANTSGGNVEGEDINGELFSRTSGGNIRLKDLACSLETSTSGGNIAVAISKLTGTININNSSGRVDLTLPVNAAVDLDLTGRMSQTSLSKFDGKINENVIRGKLNGGGTRVTVDAGDGRVSLDFK